MTTQNIRIQIRRDTADAWGLANPRLLPGELGYDLTGKKLKVGDGDTLWNTLEAVDKAALDAAEAAQIKADANEAALEVLNGSDEGSVEKDIADAIAANTGLNLDLSLKSTTDLPEGSNQYYTDGRARAALSLTSVAADGQGALAYDSTTGAFEFTPADAYTIAEVDQVVSDLQLMDQGQQIEINSINLVLPTKADAADVYTKTEVDTALGVLSDMDTTLQENIDNEIAFRVQGDADVTAAFQAADLLLAPLAGADFTGEVTGPNVIPGTPDSPGTGALTTVNDVYWYTGAATGIAYTLGDANTSVKAYVDAADALKADLESPAFSGEPQAPVYHNSDLGTSRICTIADITYYDDLIRNGPIKDNTDAIATKANAADVYTKGEVNTALGDKADAAVVYTKIESDAAFATKAQGDAADALTAGSTPAAKAVAIEYVSYASGNNESLPANDSSNNGKIAVDTTTSTVHIGVTGGWVQISA